MTKDDIIRMAREARLEGYPDELERFATLVAAHKAEVALAEAYRCGYAAGVVVEREACAKVCEAQKVGYPSYFEIDDHIQQCADTIRAWGTT